jgi:hypothetical protein
MIARFHLVLPEVLQQLRVQPDAAPATLQTWLTRGVRRRLWADDDLNFARLDPWQHSVLSLLPEALRSQGLASASLTRRGSGAEWQKGSCLHVEPIHLAAGLDDLRLMFPPPMSTEENDALFASMQLLMSLAGFELHRSEQSDRWFMWCANQYGWHTYSPRSGFAGRLQDIMPRGDHAAELKRLMTEMQMLLHDHPVNQQRQRRGIPTINSLWFWGDAGLDLISQPLPLHVISDDPYIKGLCEHLHQACWPVPDELELLLQTERMFDLDQWLMVLPRAPLAMLEPTLAKLHRWLMQGRVKQLHVHLDQWRLDFQGGRVAHGLRRFHRPKSIGELLA